MKKYLRLILIASAVLLGLLLAVGLGLRLWLGSSDFPQRIEREASAALGVPVQIKQVHVSFWPLPALALQGVRIGTQPPLTLGALQVRPQWTPLLTGRVVLASVLLQEAKLPQAGIDQLVAALQRKEQQNKATKNAASTNEPPVLPQRVVLDNVTWLDSRGSAMTVDGELALGNDLLPDHVQAKVVQGRFAGTQANLQRQSPSRWQLKAAVGGGSINGSLDLKGQGGLRGPWAWSGQLDTEGVEISALTAPSRTLSGRLQAQTSLSARAPTLGGLVDALSTQSKFTVRQAVIHGIDLEKAISTVGMNRDGETRLDTLKGEVQTLGRVVRLENLVANSGALAVRGNVTMDAQQALNGRINVDTGKQGLNDIPMAVSGTLDSPQVMPTKEAVLGAIGKLAAKSGNKSDKSLGARLGELFGK